MTDFDPRQQQASIATVTDQVRPVSIGAPVSALFFIGDRAAFVGDEETVTLVAGDGDKTAVTVHGGAILSSASDGKRLITGGDDGKVVALDVKGETTVMATDAKRRWIDNVAVHSDGAVAWSAGKTAFVRAQKGEEKSFEVPSTVGGLAFAPKGMRLALAHYNGVTLWFPNMAGSAQVLEWAGSHLGVTFSPDNKFLVTSMHEPALHGWRLADARHMRMTGYPARVKSVSWTAGGKGLAPLQTRVSAVASHPKQDILAAGYDNGTILLVRLEDGAEILVRRDGGAPVAALAWNAKGTLLAFAAQDGDAGMLAL